MKKIILQLIFLLTIVFTVSCSAEKQPTTGEAEKAISNQVKANLPSGHKLEDIDITEIGSQAKADFEGPDSQITFWNVKSRVTLTRVVRKDKFILKDKYYNVKEGPSEKKFHVWKNNLNVWVATPAAN